ncbi:MAG: vWA domain-containing protein [Pseudomonadota bacterium]
MLSAEGDSDRDNPLEAKGVVINTEGRSEAVASGAEDANRIAVRKAPSPDAEIALHLQIFEIFSVFKRVVADGEPWYFIGGKERSYRGRKLIGWIRGSDLLLWSQRQAVYPVGGGTVIYEDPDLGRPMIEVAYYGDELAARDLPIGKMPLRDSGNGVQEVIVAANRTGAETTEPGQVDVRARFWRMLEAAETMEVLFVIDNTESMDQYREPVINGIASFIEKHEASSRTKYAFAAFGDIFDSDADAGAWQEKREPWDAQVEGLMQKGQPFQFQLLDFGRQGEFLDLEEFAETFGGRYSDPQKDPPEMSLAALETAIRAAGWRKGRGLRIVIFIGDDVDRFRAIDQAVESIRQEDVLVFPINVAGRAVDGFNEAWIEDAERLREAVVGNEAEFTGRGGVFKPFKAYDSDNANHLDLTEKRVNQFLSALFIIGSELGELDTEDFLGGGNAVRERIERIETLLDKEGLPGGDFLDDYLKFSGIESSEAVASYYEAADTVHLGYIDAGRTATFVTMTPLEHDALRSAMSGVCTGMTHSGRMRSRFEDVADILAETFLGERRLTYRYGQGDGRGETIAEFFARITYLPEEYFSVFGDRTLEDYLDWLANSADSDEYRAVHKEVCLSARLLSTIDNFEYADRGDFEFVKFDERYQEPVFQPKEDLKRFDWLWGSETGARYFFIPESFFPREVNATDLRQ